MELHSVDYVLPFQINLMHQLTFHFIAFPFLRKVRISIWIGSDPKKMPAHTSCQKRARPSAPNFQHTIYNFLTDARVHFFRSDFRILRTYWNSKFLVLQLEVKNMIISLAAAHHNRKMNSKFLKRVKSWMFHT